MASQNAGRSSGLRLEVMLSSVQDAGAQAELPSLDTGVAKCVRQVVCLHVGAVIATVVVAGPRG
jgi:hypothetical protein